jgi:Transposase zinc-ribbon domain
MIDFPITELLDDASCLAWLEQYIHPNGFVCRHCGSPDRGLFVRRQAFPLYRCRACDRYYTLVTNTAFEKTRQRPATLVLLLRGIAKGEPSARLARDPYLAQTALYLTLAGATQCGRNRPQRCDDWKRV